MATYGLTDRVVKLVDAVRYSTPCLTYAKYPVINVLGHELILRKHNIGRGWYLAKSTSDEGGLATAIANDLRAIGFNVSVNSVMVSSRFMCPLRTLVAFLGCSVFMRGFMVSRGGCRALMMWLVCLGGTGSGGGMCTRPGP
ncbi:hypothetical protein [Vulcanisaeta distributa]|uniref:hypothetical protein n=1 Tax=Vulcanisaeta distributa TaxID=164451 RepID=UPI001FB3ABFB|nr:hypothetical protein [Vulcanisaeta distributa]